MRPTTAELYRYAAIALARAGGAVRGHLYCPRGLMGGTNPRFYRGQLYGAKAAQNTPKLMSTARCDSIAVLGNP